MTPSGCDRVTRRGALAIVATPTARRCAARSPACPPGSNAAVDRFCLDEAVAAVFAAADATNRHLERTAPWTRARSGDAAGAAAAVRASLDAVAALAGELAPFLPAAGDAILARLGADPGAPPWQALHEGTPIAAPSPLFPRARTR